MISIGEIWDRTMRVIAGRLGVLLTLAFLLMIVPPVVQATLETVESTSFGLRSAQLAVSLIVFLAASMAMIAMTAVASDPAVDREAALAAGRARLGPFIGVSLVVGLAFGLAVLPGAVLLGMARFDLAQARLAGSQEGVNLVLLGFGLLYFLVLLPVMLWAAARLVPLAAVIVNERRGVGAIRRSFALSRGMSMKLMGVLILYVVVFLVVLTAATSVIGIVARLLSGSDGATVVALAVALATALVTAAFSVLQAVFAAQFYLAAREAHDPA